MTGPPFAASAGALSVRDGAFATAGAGGDVGEGHTTGVYDVALAPNEEFVLSGSGDNTIRRWDRSLEEQGDPFTHHTDNVSVVTIGPNSQFAYSGSWEGELTKWNIDTHDVVAEHTHSIISSITIDPSGTYGMSTGSTSSLGRWDLDAIEDLTWFRPFTESWGNNASDVAITPDQTGYISCDDNYDPTVMKVDNIDTATGSDSVVDKYLGHTDDVETVAIGPDGFGYSGDDAGEVHKWDAETMTQVDIFAGHPHYVTDVALGPGGEYGYSASYDGTVRKWDLETMSEAGDSPVVDHDDWVQGVALDSDGPLGFSGGRDTNVRNWPR